MRESFRVVREYSSMSFYKCLYISLSHAYMVLPVIILRGVSVWGYCLRVAIHAHFHRGGVAGVVIYVYRL